MSKKIKNICILIIAILIIVATLLHFSSSLIAYKIGFSAVTSTGELAHYIAYNPIEFLGLDASKIFSLNNKGAGVSSVTNKYIYGLDRGAYKGSNPTSETSISDIRYSSAMCMFHAQANLQIWGNIYSAKVTNVIDIENNGKYTIYKYNGTNKNNSNESKVITVTDPDKKTRLTALAYLMSQTSLYERNPDETKGYIKSGNLTTDDTDKARYRPDAGYDVMLGLRRSIKHLYFQQSEGLNIKDIFKESGLFEELFYGEMDNVKTELGVSIDTEEGNRAIYETAMQIGKNDTTPILEKLDVSREQEVTYDGKNTYIGPFKVQHQGGTPTISIDGVNASNIKWTTKNSNGEFGTLNSGNIPSSTSESDLGEFYVVAEGQKLEDILGETIKVNITLSYDSYKARIVLVGNEWSGGQNLMYFAGQKTTDSKEISWTVKQETQKEISIQKQDANGNNLGIAGIKFEIYNSDKELIGTLTTDATGKTNSIKINKDQEYTIKETVNNAYGYKNHTITNAELVSGNGTLSVSDGTIKVKLTEDSVIAVDNTQKLGNLVIHKTGNDNENLSNVEFVIWRGNSYLKLNEDSVTNPIVTTDTGIDITQYNVTYVATAEEATKFKTNASGKIVINNLEIYSGVSEEYEYWICEKENNLYGYKNQAMKEADITVTGGKKLEVRTETKEVKVAISENTTVQIKNNKEVGKLTLHKTNTSGEALKDVEFSIYQSGNGSNGYLKLNSETLITTPEAGINITDYTVSYVEKVEDATKFKTNESGKVIINNLEIYLGVSKQYNYYIQELTNNNYGYKHMTLAEADITVTGGEKLEVRPAVREVKISITDNTTVTIKNTPSLGNIKLSKVDKDTDTSLSNVEFKVIVDANKYLQLKDKDGKVVERIEKAIAINKNNIASDTEYSVEYIDDSSEATIFVTDSEGKITINNLEVYSSSATSNNKYTYKLSEIKNPNYGYTISSSNIETGNIKLENEKTSEIKLTNEKALGGLSIVKADKDNQNLLLENVEFVLSIDKEANTYIALYNKAGLIKEVKGTATVNVENKATETEYIVKYVKLAKSYLEYTEAERKDLGITIFKTGSDGKILINNLAVKDTEKDVNYKYRLTETKNPYYGYEKIDGTQYFETTLTKGKIASSDVSLTNSQETFKISGYVWVENSAGKQNNYDGVYTNTAGSEDIKLKDFYIVNNGEVIKNTNSSTPIEIKLRDKTTKTIIKEKPDEFTSDGKYTFTGVEISKLANYEVIFIYDGFYYTTIVNQPDKENGSKVKEAATERETLNNKFTTIQANSQVVSKDGTVNTVQYYKDGHTSTLVKLNFATTITATTGEANFDLKAQYDSIKSSAGNTVQEIENVNLGIVLREQPKISLNSDIYGALIEFEGYNYNYKYNGRQNYYENVNNDDFGVKFEEKFAPKRYTRTVYASDIQAAAEKNKEIKLSITYKIQIANESKTLSIMPKQIINYFDARYTIKGVGLGLDESTHTITNNLSYSTPQNVEGSAEYKSTIIDFSQLIAAGKGNVKHLYITFDVSRDAILGLLNNKSTYHNASEIASYATYYGTETAKADGKQYITDQSSAGAVYAGIDKMSQPGNMEISLINHPTEAGTQILDTTYFEDDTSSAPSLLLEATESRIISGTVWEDSITNRTNNQKLGDGIYQANEKVIKGVKVELRKVNADGSIGEIATYSNGDQVTAVTDENGTYTFGHYDEQSKKYVGILPGKYVVAYTYNNKSYIVGSKNISVNDYKSTIITSKTIENAFNGQNQRWYLVEEASRYSDARDDINLRPEYNSSVGTNTVTNSTYNNMLSVETMKAYTPVMDIGIEFTEQNTENALTFEFVKHYKGVDFGIVERPSINMEIQKQITGLEIVAQNGTTIIPKGDPSDLNTRMQYVKKLDGLVSVEIDAKLLQGAKVNLEYTITLKNSSDRDYIETEYYYYGRNGKTEATARPKLIVDYLDGTISLDTAKNGETWSTVAAKDLYNDGYINEQVYKELQTGKYNIITTTAFEDVGAEGTKSVKLYAAKYLAVNDNSDMENRVEIIEITGRRSIKESIPGNYVPTEAANEQDEDKMDLLITRPTGSTTNYTPYIIAAIATFVILVSGIVIIKKKVIKS